MRIESTRLVVNSIDQDDILYTTLKKCLECKVCSCISDNIVDCEYCHTSYCLSCAKKIKKCPHMKCQNDFQYTHSSASLLTLINSLQFKCKFFIYGCAHTATIASLSAHEAECEFNDNITTQEETPKKCFKSKDHFNMSFKQISTVSKSNGDITSSMSDKIDKIYELLVENNTNNYYYSSDTPRFRTKGDLSKEIENLNEKISQLLSKKKLEDTIHETPSETSTMYGSPVSQFNLGDISSNKKNNSVLFNGKKTVKRTVLFKGPASKKKEISSSIGKIDIVSRNVSAEESIDDKLSKTKDELIQYIEDKCTNEIKRYLLETMLFNSDEIEDKINEVIRCVERNMKHN